MQVPWLKQRSTARGCLGIEINHGRYWAIHRTPDGVVSSFKPEVGAKGFEKLAEWIQQQNLGGTPTVVCLDVEQYDLQLVDAPPVESEELTDALSFRIDEMVGAPAVDKVLQAFPVPNDAYRGRMTMAFAAITDRYHLQGIVDFCRSSNLELEQILINEMAVLNLLAHIEPENSVAVLRLEDDSGVIYLYREGALYFTRKISLGTNDLGLTSSKADDVQWSIQSYNRIDALVLELQRSMDYFESQLGLGAVTQLWVMKPDGADLGNALVTLEERVNTSVHSMSLETVVDYHGRDIDLTASLAIALGGTLSYDLGR